MYLLFPGRHHVLTNFQYQYLYRIIHAGLKGMKDANDVVFEEDEKIDGVLFAVTSSNHSNTRRNPIPFYMRALAIQDFCRDLDVPFYIYGIDDVGKVENFASYTIKRIEHDSDGVFDIRPDNTLVICSTPVLKQYASIGYRILPAELENVRNWKVFTEQPWDLVEYIAKGDFSWRKDMSVLEKMHTASYALWTKYSIGEKVRMLFRDKIVGEDGDITATRDYNSYVRQMDEIAEMKYKDTAHFIKPGRIGDIGCAVGSWIKLACEDERLRESDFYGIEVSRHLYELCNQRRQNGEFENPFVYFAQKNAVTGLVFEAKSMNTIFTSSLTHEIESYGSREDLKAFIRNRYEELIAGGVWVNRDVVGPENLHEEVFLKLSKEDGRQEDYGKDFSDRVELKNYLDGLSTFARFKRFVMDFRKEEGYAWKYEFLNLDGEEFVRISLQDACEFITKKDYTDNWKSEMHERFCFWTMSDWVAEMKAVGFSIHPQSVAFVNTWMVENRFKGKAELFRMVGTKLEPMEYPVTTMFLIGEKN